MPTDEPRDCRSRCAELEDDLDVVRKLGGKWLDQYEAAEAELARLREVERAARGWREQRPKNPNSLEGTELDKWHEVTIGLMRAVDRLDSTEGK